MVRPPALLSIAPVIRPADPIDPSTSCTIPSPSCISAHPVKMTFLVRPVARNSQRCVSGGQVDFVCSTMRTPHVGPQYTGVESTRTTCLPLTNTAGWVRRTESNPGDALRKVLWAMTSQS